MGEARTASPRDHRMPADELARSYRASRLRTAELLADITPEQEHLVVPTCPDCENCARCCGRLGLVLWQRKRPSAGLFLKQFLDMSPPVRLWRCPQCHLQWTRRYLNGIRSPDCCAAFVYATRAVFMVPHAVSQYRLPPALYLFIFHPMPTCLPSSRRTRGGQAWTISSRGTRKTPLRPGMARWSALKCVAVSLCLRSRPCVSRGWLRQLTGRLVSPPTRVRTADSIPAVICVQPQRGTTGGRPTRLLFFEPVAA